MMKLAPPSTDLVIKIALGVAALGLVAYLVNRMASAAGEAVSAVGDAAGAAVGAVGDAAWAVSPTNQDNVIYQTANTLTGGTPDKPIGVRLYEFFHTNQ